MFAAMTKTKLTITFFCFLLLTSCNSQSTTTKASETIKQTGIVCGAERLDDILENPGLRRHRCCDPGDPRPDPRRLASTWAARHRERARLAFLVGVRVRAWLPNRLRPEA